MSDVIIYLVLEFELEIYIDRDGSLKVKHTISITISTLKEQNKNISTNDAYFHTVTFSSDSYKLHAHYWWTDAADSDPVHSG